MSQIPLGIQTAGVCLILLLSAANVHAAEEGANVSTEHLNEICKWINLVVLIVAIVWGWKHWKVNDLLLQARERVGLAISKATVAKAEADRQLREAETKLANLQKEVAGLREEAQREAAAEVERIRAATQADEQKIAVAAKGEIEAAERAARMELKELAAKLAVDGAESLLVKQLTPAMQESLISGFVKTLEGRPN